MGFQISKIDKTTRVDIDGHLIIANRQELKQRVLAKLEEGDREFDLNFHRAVWIDPSGLGVLVSLKKRIQDSGGKLRLLNLNGQPLQIMEQTLLNTLFTIENETEGAVQ